MITDLISDHECSTLKLTNSKYKTLFPQVRGEQCVILRTKEGKVVLTNSDEIGLKEWSVSLRTTLRCSHELLSGLAKKAGKIYGTDGNCNNSNNSATT